MAANSVLIFTLDMQPMWDAFVVNAPGFGLIGAIFLFAVRSVIQSEFKKLDERYVLRSVADIKFEEIDKRFDYLSNSPSSRSAKAHSGD